MSNNDLNYNKKSDVEESNDREETSNAKIADNKQVKLINSHIKVCNELCKLENYIEQINNDLCRMISRLNNANCLINAMRKSLCDSI